MPDFGIRAGDASKTVYVRLRDSTTGLAKTGLTFESAGNACYYTLPLAVDVQIPLVTLAAPTTSYSSGGFVQVDATTSKGLYRLDLPDAAIASGAFVVINIEFDGIIEESMTIPLHTPAVNVTEWRGTAVSNPTVEGVPDVNAKTWNDLATVALPLIPTIAGRTLDCSAGGEAGLDWANVGGQTTTVGLTNTTVGIVTLTNTLTTYTNDTPQTGDTFAKFAGITLLAEWLGSMAGKQVEDATAKSEIRDTGAGSGTWDATIHSLEAGIDSRVVATDIVSSGSIGTSGGAISAVTLVATTTTNTDLATLTSGMTSLTDWLGAMAGKHVADSTAITEINATGASGGSFDATADSLEAGIDSRVVATDIVSSGSIGTSGGAISAVTLVATTTDVTNLHASAATSATQTTILASLPAALIKGTADSGSASTCVDEVRDEADADYWKGCYIRSTSGATDGQVRLITGFTVGSPATITFAPDMTASFGTSTYEILLAAAANVIQWSSADVATVDAAGYPVVTIKDGAGAGEINTNAGAIVLVDTVTTYTGNTLQTADVATLITTVGVAGAGLGDLGGMSTEMLAEVEAECNDAMEVLQLDHLLHVADAATTTTNSILAKMAASDGVFSGFSAASDSLEALRDQGDSAWITAPNDLDATGVADAVWDASQASHVTAGEFGVIASEIAAITAAGPTLSEMDTAHGLLATEAKQDTIDTEVDKVVVATITNAAGTDISADVADVPTVAEFNARTPTAAQLAYIVENAATGVPVTFSDTATTTTNARLVNVDGSGASAVDDQYNGRLIVFTSGTNIGVVTDITDYDGTNKDATITAIPTAPAAGDNARLI